MRFLPALVAVCVLGAAASCLEATNPFDPDTPAEQQQPAVLHGTVSDEDGPVEGAAVVVADSAGADHTATTDALGGWRIDSVVPGTVDLEVSQAAHFSFARSLTVIAGDERVVDVVLQTLTGGGDGVGHISGVARKGAQTNQPAASQDHSGITVEVEGTGVRTVTNAAGAWDVFVQPGSYVVDFTAPDHLPTTAANVAVTAANTTALDTITLAINPGGAAGTVRLEGFADDDTANAGLIVSLADGSTTTTTAADGSYVLPNLPAGVVTLRFVGPATHGVVEKVITVTAGVQASVDDVLLPRARGAIVGTVDLVGRNDDSGAFVTVTGDGLFALTAADGTFRIDGVSTGSREIVVTADGFARVVRAGIDVVANRDSDLGALALVAGGGDFDINGGAAFTSSADVSIAVDSDDAVQMRVSEDPTFSDVAVPVAFAPTSTFTLSAGDGEKTVFVELIDSGGAIDVLGATIVLDTTPPEQTSVVLNNGAAFSNSVDALVTVGISASDAGSGVAAMQVSLDGTFTAPFVPLAAQQVVALDNVDGAHVVAVRFRDQAGNITAIADAASDSIVLDRAAPTATVSLNGGDALATSLVASLSITMLSGADDVALMAVSTDPSVAIPVFTAFAASTTVLLAPGEGTRSIGVKLQDAAGNTSSAFSDSIVVDQTPPGAVVLSLDAGAAFSGDNVVTVGLTSDDAAAKARFSVDGVFDGSTAAETFSAIIPTTITLPAGDGTKTVLAQLQDAAGNASVVVADAIVVDATAPVLGSSPVVVNAGSSFTNSVSVTAVFSVSDATEMALATDGAVDTESFAPFSSAAVALLPASDCVVADCKSVCAVFRDAAGNSTAQRCDSITLDTTVPSTPILEEGDTVQASDDFTFHLTSLPFDGFFSHIEVLVEPLQPTFQRVEPGPATPSIPYSVDDDAIVQPAAEDNLTLSELAVKRHVVRVRAVDRAGNVSPETSLTLTIDDVVPETPALAGVPNRPAVLPPGCSMAGSINAETVQVNFEKPARASGDATFSHYEIRGPLLPEFIATSVLDGILFTLKPNDDQVLEIVAVDAAGNRSGTATVCMKEDSTAPSQPLILPGDGIVRANSVDIFLESVPLQSEGVVAYELKDANDFHRQQSLTGPFVANLSTTSVETEVCLRAVDATNNTGIADCVVVSRERVSVAVDAIDEPRQQDIFGDFVAFVNTSDHVAIRDLRGAIADIEVNNAASPQDLRVLNTARVRIEGRGSDMRVVAQVQGSNSTVLFARIDARPAVPVVERGTFRGSDPDVQGNNVVYVGLDGASIRRRAPIAPPDADPGTATVLDPSPTETGVLVSASGITRCSDTGPRVFDNVVVWCQLDAGVPTLKRRLLGNTGNPIGVVETVSSSPVAARRQSTLSLDEPGGINQPVVSNLFMAWTEERGGESTLQIMPGPGRALTTPTNTGFVVDTLTDISGPVVVGVNRRGTLFNDIVAVDLLRSRLVNVTDDAPPQSAPAVDGARISFTDVAVGQRILMSDRTDTRWTAATSSLEFEPVTSTEMTAWLVLSDDELCLATRLVGPVPTVTLLRQGDGSCEPIVFNGPTEADATWAVGGKRLAWLAPTLSPTNFILKVKDIDSGVIRTVSSVASQTMAIDPDGDAIAWVEASGAVKRTDLGAGLAGTVVDLGTPGGSIPHIDIDNGLVVIQQGGARDNRNDDGAILCRDTTDNAFRAVTVAGVAPQARGPKIAKSVLGANAGPTVLAYLDIDSNGNGDAKSCINFTCGTNCTDVNALGIGRHNDTLLRLARDGSAATVTDELGLRQVVLTNVFTGSRTFVASGVDVERQSVDVAENRIVWGDTQLGSPDIWELTLR
jgi:hypothetical protein